MSKKNIRWGFIQPLTGGMYIGAREAIGHDAEFIISYPGLNDIKSDKNVGNEYNLTCWLNKQGIKVPYYIFKRKMFEDTENLSDIKIYKDDELCTPNYSNIDIVGAVPVCSGLSMVTSGTAEGKKSRNCNMTFITRYTLGIIKPKMYIFENAPTLMGDRGEMVREELENIAYQYGYSVLYYKTDTILHDNAQKRPRTFIIFQKWLNNKMQEPVPYEYENITTNLIEYLLRIPKNASQQIPIKLDAFNTMLLRYTKYKYGENWRETIPSKHPLDLIVKYKWYDDFIEFIQNQNDISADARNKSEKFIRHAEYKKSLGLNFMSCAATISKDYIGSIQFKSMQSVLHPIEDRLFTIRECLHFMGMPNDFEMQGDPLANYAKIGQNVPVRTAKFIFDQACKIIENWNNQDRKTDKNIIYINNIKQRVEKI